MTAISVRPGRLRDAAEEIERSTGLRVQIIGGTLVVSPTLAASTREPSGG